MKNMVLVLALSLWGTGHAMATTLLDLVNPGGGTTPYNLTFTATDVNSDVAFGGYDVPAGFSVEYIEVIDTTAGSGNLLGSTWNFTQAAQGSDTGTFNDGTSVPALDFAGVVVGDFDTYDQNITTVVGDQYDVSFTLLANGDPESELTVSAANTSTGTPEPGSLLLLGSGFVGIVTACKRRKKA